MRSTLIWGTAIGVSLGMWVSTWFTPDPVINAVSEPLLVAILVGWLVSINRSARRRDVFEECDWPAPGEAFEEAPDEGEDQEEDSSSEDRTRRQNDRTVLPSGDSLLPPPFRRPVET